jgi:hypothetical protein
MTTSTDTANAVDAMSSAELLAGLDGRDVTALSEAMQRQMTTRAQPAAA